MKDSRTESLLAAEVYSDGRDTILHRSPQFLQWMITFIFLAAIYLPLLDKFIPLAPKVKLVEKRVLSPEPKAQLKDLSSFPQKFDKFYDDHFPYRNFLIRLNSMMKIKAFGISPVPGKVVIGKYGWLFFAGEGTLDNYKRSTVFSEDGLRRAKEVEESLHDWCERRGIKYYLVIAPEKYTIYPELMPMSITRSKNEARIDQVVTYLRNYSKVRLIDTRDALMKEKGRIPLFRRLDSHWNQYGAMLASEHILRVIAKDFPAISPRIMSAKDFDITFETVKKGDLINLLGIEEGIFLDRLPRLEPKDKTRVRMIQKADISKMVVAGIQKNGEAPDASLPRMTMSMDSFGDGLVPFLSECFSKSYYIWSTPPNEANIKSEQPNVFIVEINERYLKNLESAKVLKDQ